MEGHHYGLTQPSIHNEDLRQELRDESERSPIRESNQPRVGQSMAKNYSKLSIGDRSVLSKHGGGSKMSNYKASTLGNTIDRQMSTKKSVKTFNTGSLYSRMNKLPPVRILNGDPFEAGLHSNNYRVLPKNSAS